MGMWMAAVGLGIQALAAMQQGEGGGSALELARDAATRAQTATEATERPLEEIKPATDTTKQTAEYFARIADAIKNIGSVRELAHVLQKDMETFQGGRIEPGIVTPGEAKVPKVQAVKLAELEQQEEQQEEEKEEPFVRGPSLFG